MRGRDREGADSAVSTAELLSLNFLDYYYPFSILIYMKEYIYIVNKYKG